MSKDDKEDGGGSLLQFPRVFLPGSFDAPGADVSQPVEEVERPVPGVWPSMPGVSEMAPPLALTMPGIPKPDDGDAADGGDEEGVFVPPPPEDPANPTARDALAVCMALVTAMGVAAAHGIWHRARRRSALADEARASADKAQAKAGAREAGRGGKRTSLLDSPGGKKGSRAGGRSRHGGAGKDHGGSHKGPKRGGSPKGPKARQDGRRKDRDGSKRRKDRKDRPGWRKRRDPDARSPKRPDTKQPKTPKTPKGGSKKRPGKLAWKGLKRGNRKKPKGWTSGRPKGGGKGAPKRKQPKKATRPLTWKAPKRRPGPGQGKGITGRKRWAGRKSTPTFKRHRKSWSRRTWKRGRKWVKRWTLRRRAAAARPRTGWSWQGFQRSGGQHRAAGSARQRARSTYTGTGMPGSSGAGTPPPPPPGFGGMRPPPGASHRVWADAERVDNPARPRQESGPAALAGAPAGGWPALPAGASEAAAAGAAPEPPSAPAGPPATNGDRPVATPVPTTQYSDAELTIYDVIDADADMAEEILAGVDEARATADGCEQLYTRLETVHAKIVELRVPGLLAGWMLRLLDQTGNVRSNALAIAANLPAASEAISIAGSNAAARYQHAADTTRDYGHTRPAEREYHDE